MKAISLLLAVYVFFSALYPCSDSETCFDEERQGIAVVADLTHEHSSQELDVCTPFCICSCCSAHVRLIALSSFEAGQLPLNSKPVSHYVATHDLNVGHSIWQPPRV